MNDEEKRNRKGNNGDRQSANRRHYDLHEAGAADYPVGQLDGAAQQYAAPVYTASEDAPFRGVVEDAEVLQADVYQRVNGLQQLPVAGQPVARGVC